MALGNHDHEATNSDGDHDHEARNKQLCYYLHNEMPRNKQTLS